GLPAGAAAAVEDDWSGVVVSQSALYRPQYLLAPARIALARLRLDHFIDLGSAVTVPVTARAAAIIQVEDRIWIRAARLQINCYGKVLPKDLRKILRGIDEFEFSMDVHVLQLIDQQYCGVAVRRPIARGHLDIEQFIRAVA